MSPHQPPMLKSPATTTGAVSSQSVQASSASMSGFTLGRLDRHDHRATSGTGRSGDLDGPDHTTRYRRDLGWADGPVAEPGDAQPELPRPSTILHEGRRRGRGPHRQRTPLRQDGDVRSELGEMVIVVTALTAVPTGKAHDRDSTSRPSRSSICSSGSHISGRPPAKASDAQLARRRSRSRRRRRRGVGVVKRRLCQGLRT